jgi:hypothetical protein
MSIEIQPYFAEGERYPALIGLRAEGDEYETAYVSKSELVDALDENDKLRELVLYMWDFSCVVPDEPHTSKEELDYSVEVWKRIRELGIEVD